MRTLLANLIRTIHIGLFLFIILGWTCPSPGVLKAHAFLIPLLILHWKTNNNTCFLTNLEYWIRESPPATEEDEGRFVKNIVETICRTSPRDTVIEACVYLIMIGGMLISLWRLDWI